MGGDGEAKADERHEGGHGVHDENGRQGMARGRRERKVWGRAISKQLLCVMVSLRRLLSLCHVSELVARQRTSVVPDYRPVALAILAVAQHAEVDAAVGRNGDARDDGRGQRGQQQQTEGDEE